MSCHIDIQPQKDGWVKYFSDGSVEYGYDQDVDLGCASWTQGKQNNMRSVALRAGNITVHLFAELDKVCKFWQSDDYEVVLGSRNPTRITRRIEQKLEDHTWQIIEIDLRTSEIREYTSQYKI